MTGTRRRPPAEVPREFHAGYNCLGLVMISLTIAASAVMLGIAACREAGWL